MRWLPNSPDEPVRNQKKEGSWKPRILKNVLSLVTA
jgi:hypothetical protein